MKITVICVGKLKEQYWKEAAEEYLKRLKKFAEINIVEIRDEKIPKNLSGADILKIKSDEGARIISRLSEQAYNTALEINGQKLNSEQLASKIQNVMNDGFSEITFIIGGTHGLSDDVTKKCRCRLSFSDMTFPHRLMFVILLEQIYRSFKIINNEPYHY